MDTSIPEITYSSKSLTWLFEELKKKYPNLTVAEVSFVLPNGHRKKSNSFDSLEKDLHSLRPAYRDKVRITFELSPPARAKNKVKARIHFTSEGSSSKIELNGPKNSRETFGEDIGNFLHSKKRKITNTIGKGLTPPLVAVFASLPFIFGSITGFKNSSYQALFTGCLGLPSLFYFYLKPHSFFITSQLDHFYLLIPTAKTLLQMAKTTLIGTLLIFGVSRGPLYLKLDQYLLTRSESAQRDLLRHLLGSAQLSEIQALKSAAMQYDRIESAAEKNGSVTTMVMHLNNIIGPNGFLNAVPIGKLQVFVSSAKDLQRGNWLQETPLLLMKADTKNKSFLYQTRLLNSAFANERLVTIDEWYQQPILKDKFGKTWSRGQFVRELAGELHGQGASPAMAIDRLRKFPERNIEFALKDSEFSTSPQNSVEQETVRAIAEEVLRTYNVMQRELSGMPNRQKEK